MTTSETLHATRIIGLDAPKLDGWRVAIGLGTAAALGMSATALLPISTGELTSLPRPTTSYDAALARWADLRALDNATVSPVGHSRLLTHNMPTKRVAILIHGITNCPQQFVALGEMLFARGYNVLIPRMPHNGLANRTTDKLKQLTASELCRFTDTVIDIAAGLGKQITIAGLSAGGNLAAWAAQHRPEIAQALVIAPSFGILRMSQLRHTLVRNLFCRLPPITWIDSPEVVQSKPKHTYLRNNSRAIGEILRLGMAAYRNAQQFPPAARSIAVVTNGGDCTVDNRETERMIRRWRMHSTTSVSTYEFAAMHGLPHDLIDPAQPNARVDLVYPMLLDLMERG